MPVLAVLPVSRRRSGRRDDRGAVIALAALLIVTIFISVSFAVDLGRLTLERRDQQANADVIALDMVRLATGVTEKQIVESNEYLDTLYRSAAANNTDAAQLEIAYGTFDKDTGAFVETADTEVPNAVRVLARGTTQYFFATVFTDANGKTSRTGIASLDGVADLSIGSKLAEMRSGNSTRLNFLLKNRLGGPDFTFTGVGYQGLANTNATYEDIAVGAGFASPDAFLDAELTLAEFADASANAFNANGEPSNVSIAVEIADRSRQREIDLARPNKTFKVRDILMVDVGGPPAWASANANFFDLFIAAAEVVNGKNATTVCTEVADFDDGFANVPRDAIDFDPVTEIVDPTSSTCTSTIEPAQWITDGRPGASARTAQLRAEQTAQGDLDFLGLTGRAVVPATVSAAGARADLQAIRCDRVTGDHRTDTLVTPEPLTMEIGVPGYEFTLADALGAVTISVDVTKSFAPSSGSAALIEDQAIDTVEPGPGQTPTFGFTLTKDDVKLVVDGSLASITTEDILTDLLPRLNVLLAQIDHRGTRYLQTFGIGIGGSDLLLDDVRCNSPLLVG